MDFWVFVIVMTGISSATTVAVKIVQRWRSKRYDFEKLEARLAHIESIVETSALDVERIAESHRFTAKLLAERSAAGRPIELPPTAT
ncbi:MAG: hypothetical protein M3081_14385 [Gemmatimonadota bacterium]|nr:hypothetical protein [Gemmatimonadota bacterium]